MFRWNRMWILAVIVAVAIAPAMARKEFVPIVGGEFLLPSDMTDDGTMFVFTSLFGTGGWTYTAEEGLVQIDFDGCSGQLRMSDDGSVIVGNNEDAVTGLCQPHRYEGNGE